MSEFRPELAAEQLTRQNEQLLSDLGYALDELESQPRAVKYIAVVGSANETVQQLIARAAELNSERVVLVGGDVLDEGGATLAGCFAAAAVAAVIAASRDPAVPLNGAVLADHCLVGAGAVVTSKINAPAGSLLLGSPAKIVGTITKEQWDALEEDAEKYLKNAQKWL